MISKKALNNLNLKIKNSGYKKETSLNSPLNIKTCI